MADYVATTAIAIVSAAAMSQNRHLHIKTLASVRAERTSELYTQVWIF